MLMHYKASRFNHKGNGNNICGFANIISKIHRTVLHAETICMQYLGAYRNC